MKPTYDELVFALQGIVEELNEWEVPQVDDNDEFGPETALGHARSVLDLATGK